MSRITLYCGDCMERFRTMSEASIDCIVTDPPFGVGFKQDFYDDSAEVVFKDIDILYKEWFRLLKEDSYLFLFVGIKTIDKWVAEGRRAGFEFKNIIATRAFNNGRKLKNNFAFVLQPILLFSKSKGRAFNNIDFFPTSNEWKNDKRNKKKTPFTYQYPNFIMPDIAFGTETFGSNKKQIVHPNAKSEPLCRFFIEIATNKDDIVMDPFMGSGTTGVACSNCGRGFIGIEQDERYFAYAKNRIMNTNPLLAGI